MGPSEEDNVAARSSSGGFAPSDGSTRRCHVTPYYARAITLPRAPSPVGVQCTRHQENSAGPKLQTLPNFLGAGRAFLPLSKPVTVRVGRRPPAPSDQNAKGEPDHQWLLRLNQLLEPLILLPGHFAPSQPLLQNLQRVWPGRSAPHGLQDQQHNPEQHQKDNQEPIAPHHSP